MEKENFEETPIKKQKYNKKLLEETKYEIQIETLKVIKRKENILLESAEVDLEIKKNNKKISELNLKKAEIELQIQETMKRKMLL